jgi:predicted RNase H-like nuclease
VAACARCFGIDLAWSDANPSGVCALDDDGRIVDERELGSDDEIVNWLAAQLDGHAVLAIDASLLVSNATGRRQCETELAGVYGGRKAGPHPSNRSLFLSQYGRIRGEDLAGRLTAFGFGDPWAGGERTLLEAYPHPTLIEAFGLPERLLYKSKRGVSVDGRRIGLRNLARLLDGLAGADPPLRGAAVAVPNSARGRQLKSIEDRLDARLCAWIAAVWDRHGEKRVRLFGTAAEGHIAVPFGRFAGDIRVDPVPAAGKPPG